MLLMLLVLLSYSGMHDGVPEESGGEGGEDEEEQGDSNGGSSFHFCYH